MAELRKELYQEIKKELNTLWIKMGKEFITQEDLEDFREPFRKFQLSHIKLSAKQMYLDPRLGDQVAIDLPETDMSKYSSYDLKERSWALRLLECEAKLPDDFRSYLEIAIIMDGIREARAELQTKTLSINVFSDPRERETLRRNFTYSIHWTARHLFDEIADYAVKHLSDTPVTTRAHQGIAKHNALIDLMQCIQRVDDDDQEVRYQKVRDILHEELSKDPKDSDLTRNRGGFFGAYKTYARCMNKHGVHKNEFKFENRTAVSSTDRMLIKLFNDVETRLAKLKPPENTGDDPRVEILPDDYTPEESRRSVDCD